ncbi:Tfp pilus assembly protein PilX [Anaerohalosphaera lusitana]|uniref:Tfp pilus assembly protein PilX n=1 Tax=Anaerohalosphaera lusitana TaxID=1936003 RepID=A0A1U9NKZ3_9BACT|nr:hypothetical protein [Anaerohalosphaera lusitana]AQT68394.1 Tfp pilus assembly protein PilX [Anaerohalosphaera lusitana]
MSAKKRKNTRPGFAMVMSMMFLVLFSSLAVGIFTTSSGNVEIADNQREGNLALVSAESGIDITRYWLNGIEVSGSVAPSNRLSEVYNTLTGRLNGASVTNLSVNYNSLEDKIEIPDPSVKDGVVLDGSSGQKFRAELRQLDGDTLELEVTGISGQISRKITTNFSFGQRSSRVFDYGVASKGPIEIKGNADIMGANDPSEASLYIESLDEHEALAMNGNVSIAGDVDIANPDGYVDMKGPGTIGGESGQDAIDNHVDIGVDTVEFPMPDCSEFEAWAVNTVDSSTKVNGNVTLENIRIEAGTNPTFGGNVTLRGVVYIESPNHVKFSGNTDLQGVIVAEGDIDNPVSGDKLEFTGNMDNMGVDELPSDSQFDGLREKTGTFIMAPGFEVEFKGNFDTIDGAIAASGIRFTGNAGGTITNSLINYSDETMTFQGNARVYIDRSDSDPDPSGFEGSYVLEFMQSTYSEGGF